MASPAQNAFVNTVPLPSITNDPDPNGFMAPGPALIALDPNDPAAVQQPVGSAMDAVAGQEEDPVDAVTAQLAAGKRVRITSQTQWNAMSPHEKEVIRAAKSAGGQIRSSDAVRIYQDSVKRSRANQVQTVTTSDGRKVDMVNNQFIPAEKQPEAVKMERWKAEDGTMVLTDLTTGRTFPAWNEKSGEDMRGEAKLSPTQEEKIKRDQLTSENLGARLDALTRFTESDKVSYDDDTGIYSAAPWMGTKVADVRAALEKEKEGYDKRIEVALRPVNRSSKPADTTSSTPQATPSPTPSVTPSPTPRPNPMPTPSQNITKAQYDALAPGATFTWNGKTLTKK
jgi:hypothetical protein